MKKQSACPLRPLVVLSLLLCGFSLASAQGVELGVSAYPAQGVAAAHVGVALFEAEQVEHQARAGVTYGFEGLPALSATYLLRDTSRTFLATYLGAGVGLSFGEAPAPSTMFSAHALAGVRAPIVGGLGAYSELVVAGNVLGTSMSFGVGLTYTLGGMN